MNNLSCYPSQGTKMVFAGLVRTPKQEDYRIFHIGRIFIIIIAHLLVVVRPTTTPHITEKRKGSP
jgi:hypothetical protein